MSRDIYTKYIFFVILAIISTLVSLNYFIKTPNDGVLYLSAAEYLVKNGVFLDPTRSFGEYMRPIPTPQIGIVLYLATLMKFFKSFWIIAYVIIFSIVWTILVKKLIYFSKKNFVKAGKAVYFFPFFIFFSYDYLISASSFYNEALYFPLLIFAFLKVINYIQKKKNIFENSYLFILFLIIGIIFRIQHFILLGSLLVFSIFYFRIKEFIYLSFITILNFLIFFFLLYFLKQYDSYIGIGTEVDKTFLDYIINLFQSQLDSLGNSVFKNLKVNLSLYVNYLNLPKIIDFHLVNNFFNLSEFLYLILAVINILTIIFYFVKEKNKQIGIFLLTYVLLTSVFLFFLTDYTTRYFMMSNFCILFFLFSFIKLLKKKISWKLIIVTFLFFILILSFYGYGYFKGINKFSAYNVGLNFKDFNKNRNNFFDSNDIIITRYRYNAYWFTGESSINPKELINSNLMNNRRRYFFLGDINYLYKHLSEKIVDIKNYSYLETSETKDSATLQNKNFSIWRIYFETDN